MRKIKEYKYVILIGLVVLGFAFFWFSYRPYQARKYCNSEAFLHNFTGEINSPEWLTQQEKLYSDCLRYKGI